MIACTYFSLFLFVATFATGANSHFNAYAACRTEARALRSGGCTWRSGSLFAVNGWYSTRIAFRAGRPGGIVIYQPGVSGHTEFVPSQVHAIELHIGDLSAVDGDYLVCPLRSVPDPTDHKGKLYVACLAGAKHLRAGTVAWAFSETPTGQRRHSRR